MTAEHYVNEGGAVAARNHRAEQKNIKILKRKWGKWIMPGRNNCEIKFNYRYNWDEHLPEKERIAKEEKDEENAKKEKDEKAAKKKAETAARRLAREEAAQ
jgi:hypothetical protein